LALLTWHSAAGGTAHLVQTGFGGFYDGIAHWALSPRDLMLTLGVALLGGLGGTRAARAVVLALPAAWLVGGWIGWRLPELGELPWATTASLGLVGLLVAVGKLPPTPLIATLALAAGLLHGLANGSLMLAEERQPIALYGTVAAVALVTLLGAAALARVEHPAGRIAIRVGGSWLAAIALLWLAWLAKAPA